MYIVESEMGYLSVVVEISSDWRDGWLVGKGRRVESVVISHQRLPSTEVAHYWQKDQYLLISIIMSGTTVR